MYVYDESSNNWIRLSSTPAYRKRKRVLRDTWTVAGIVILVLPFWIQIILLAFGVFLSLSFLDESGHYTQPG
jgi:hypothetical protein